MTKKYLFELHGQGLEEHYPEATVYDTSNHRIGEATSHAYGGGAWAVRTEDFAGHLPFNSPAIQYVSRAEAPSPPPPEAEETIPGEEEDEILCGCGGKGWEVFNADPDAGRLGDVQRCDCGILPDDESAYDAASAAGLLVDVNGNVLPQPWGAYAAEVRRQRRVEALQRRLSQSGRLLGTCSPRIRFYALGNHVFCDKSTTQVHYSTTLQDFETMIARSELPGFRPA
ncbi:MAG: hypothetical protein JF614_27965 [Acidobacteria bacterium]|nr:hypothetical protein [Acidobacteriota bacterium]